MTIYGKQVLKTRLETLGQNLMDALWPPCCPLCKIATVSPDQLCTECWDQTPLIIGQSCKYCGVNIDGAINPICLDCIDTPRPWSYGHSATIYGDKSKELVLALKNGGNEGLASIVARLIYLRNPEAFIGLDALTAMPLHWRRLLSRGYNQSGLIGNNLSKLCHIPYAPNLINRNRYTKKQGKHADFEQRFKNIENAFIVPKSSIAMVEGKSIGLIDDVLTSGASLHFATEALLLAGARDVCIFVFARAGVND